MDARRCHALGPVAGRSLKLTFVLEKIVTLSLSPSRSSGPAASVQPERNRSLLLEEGDRWLAEIKIGLRRLEAGDPDLPSSLLIMNAARSIKEASAALGWARVSEIMRILEGLFDEVRRGERLADEKVLNVARRSVACVARMLAEHRSDDSPARCLADLRIAADGSKVS